MSTGKTRRLISSALAAGLLAATPGQAQVSLFNGFNPQDPIGSTAVELWRLVREKCVPGDRKVVVGTASLPVTVQAFTRDQGNHLMGAVHSAFSRLPGVEMAPFSDVGAVLEVQNAGLLSAPNAGDAEAMMNRVEILITASGQKVGPNTHFSINAIGRGSVQCFLSVGPVVVPPSLAGEIYVPAENIFDKAARDVWTKSRGTNEIVVKARMTNGVPLDRNLPDHFTRMMSKAVQSAERNAIETSIGNPTKLIPVSPERASRDSENRWEADVVVEPRRNGYHISIEVSRKDTTPVFSDGLVPADELPALQWASLSTGRSASTAIPRLSAAPMRIEDRVDGRQPNKIYSFSLARESYVEVDLPIDRVRGPHRTIPVDVFGPGNMPQRTIHLANGARPNLRRYKLPPGQYTIKVATPGPARYDYTLRARAIDSSGMLEPEGPGRLLSQFQDWYAGYFDTPTGRRACYAYTPAIEVSPLGWREELPVIWLSAFANETGNLSHLLDKSPFYQEGSDFEVSVNESGSERQIAVSTLNTFIQPLKTNALGQHIIDMDAVSGYNRGTTLELRGLTKSGEPTRILYSLQGYRSAVNALALACGRRDVASALVWK